MAKTFKSDKAVHFAQTLIREEKDLHLANARLDSLISFLTEAKRHLRNG
jgi:hypothetical protein